MDKNLLTNLNLNELRHQQNVYKAEASFYEFFKQAWINIEGDKEFADGKHIKAICEHLEAVSDRQIKNLLINLPPRFAKSSIISVAFPAWVWIRKPHERFLCSSYGLQLANRDSRYCRSLIQSPWYQKNWGDRFELLKDQNTKGRFDNTKKGYRIATSSKSAVTGEGANFLISDDPNNIKDNQSEVDREGRIDWWTQIWSTRLNDKKNDCRIVVQQRTHEKDISGHIIANDTNNEWVKLILPMEFEERRRSMTVPFQKGTIWEDWRTQEGQLLWPERIGTKEVESIKLTLGSYGYAGQYQQRPSPAEGGIIKKSWFRRWVLPDYPKFDIILQSWDTGYSDKPTAAYSAMTTWGVWYNDNDMAGIILLSMWRDKVNYHELRERGKRLAKDYKDTGVSPIAPVNYRRPLVCLIEEKATGVPLIHDLRVAGIPAVGYMPKGDKQTRVQMITPYIESGMVWLPTKTKDQDRLLPWAEEFVESVASFPNAESRDLVDTMSQALSYLRDRARLRNPKDDVEVEYPKKKVVLY
jgi:predicted phage terminase large subunit-like protein